MKTRTILGLVATLALLATPAMADLYVVDFDGVNGDDISPGVTVGDDWGEYEPPTKDGSYGDLDAKEARMVLGNDDSGDTNIWATITYPEKISMVTVLTHLDGIIDDSYSIEVDGVEWGTYEDTLDDETWLTDSYSGTPGYTLTITITNPNYSWASDWGQLAIDKVEAVPVPLPGAVLLGFLGLSYAGMKLRRSV